MACSIKDLQAIARASFEEGFRLASVSAVSKLAYPDDHPGVVAEIEELWKNSNGYKAVNNIG